MGTMYSRIEGLCAKRGISVTKMCRDANVARAPLTELKKGRTKELNAENASKIADFFGVSVSYLRGTEEKPATKSDGLEGIDLSKASEKQRQLIQNILQLTDPQADALLPMTEALVSRK